MDLGAEVVKTALTFAVSVTTLALGWFVGARITAAWDQRKTRRELIMATTDAFYESYGEFFAIWKEWVMLRRVKAGSDSVDDLRFQLLARAAAAEGAVEALLLKLAAERRLDSAEVEALGCFRQAYQVLRESIRDDRPVGLKGSAWYSSEVPGYAVFKGLATRLARIVSREDKPPEEGAAQQAFQAITSNRFESGWVEIGRQFLNATVVPPTSRRAR